MGLRYRPEAFFRTEGRFNRPPIELEIYRVDSKAKNEVWEIFRKYHYLNTDLHSAAEQYVGIWKNRLVAHTGIIHFPLQMGKKRVHRLVVLPDYQGIGIGTAFITAIGGLIAERGFELNLTTTTPAIVGALARHESWILSRYGRVKGSYENMEKTYGLQSKRLTASTSRDRVTYSFWYKGGTNGNDKKDTR